MKSERKIKIIWNSLVTLLIASAPIETVALSQCRTQIGTEPTTPPTLAKAPASPGPQQKSNVKNVIRDIAYGEHQRQRLDIYQPDAPKDAPVMIFVHGGAWAIGNKKNVDQKPNFFCNKGWAFCSVGYRLVPEGRHPNNVNDVANAITWVHDNAQQYGIDPDKIFIMGHSAGGHLASLVATSKAPLRTAGKSNRIIKGVISLDTAAYDIAALLETPRARLYRKIFGDNEAILKDVSPLNHISTNQSMPPFLIYYTRGLGKQRSTIPQSQAEAFFNALQQEKFAATIIDATDRNHSEINKRFGADGDTKVTSAAEKFLNEILGVE